MDEKTENSWDQRRFYMGLDWAKECHEIAIVDREWTNPNRQARNRFAQ